MFESDVNECVKKLREPVHAYEKHKIERQKRLDDILKSDWYLVMSKACISLLEMTEKAELDIRLSTSNNRINVLFKKSSLNNRPIQVQLMFHGYNSYGHPFADSFIGDNALLALTKQDICSLLNYLNNEMRKYL